MKWRLTAKTFIEPVLYDVGTIMEYQGPIGMSFEPLDAEAQERWDEWAKANPTKAVGAKPFEELSIVERPQPEKVEPPKAVDIGIEESTGMAMLKSTKAAPGVSQGGKAVKVP